MDIVSITLLIVIILLAMHLVEEVKTGFRKKMLIGEMPKPLFVGLNILLYAYCFTTFFLSVRGHALAIPLIWIFAIAMFLNAPGISALWSSEEATPPAVSLRFSYYRLHSI